MALRNTPPNAPTPRRTVAAALAALLPVVANCTPRETGTEPDDRDDPVITITVAPTAITIRQGTSELLTARITRGGGFEGNVDFALVGAPGGVQGTFRDATTSGLVTTATLELEAGDEVETGTYGVSVRGSGSGVASVTAPLEVMVEPRLVPILAVAVDPAAASVEQGQSIDVVATVARVNGLPTPPPTFDVTGLPTGVTWSVTDPVETGDGPVATITFDVAQSTAVGIYALTVLAMATSAEDASTSFELTVIEKPAPAPVRFGPDEIQTGSATICRHLQDTGAAYCWGLDHKGQVGDGTANQNEPSPTLVVGNHTWSWIVTAGTHTCGLDDTGKAWCWGDDGMEALGNGAGIVDSATPVAVAGDRTYVGIDAGSSTTCALEADGTAWCWGWDFYEQTGNGAPRVDQPEPVRVSGDIAFAAIAVGNTHTCGLDVTGKAWCWGNDGNAELGDGPPIQNRNVPVRVAGGMTFLEIGIGSRHTCALDEAGAAYCWGLDLFGALGDGAGSRDVCGTFPCAHEPVAVAGGHRFAALGGHGAGDHMCGLEANGQVWCWGSDNNGQLGDGPGAPDDCQGQGCAFAPVAVTGGHVFRSITSGGVNTCGVDVAGDTWCWGDDSAEQLGDGVGGTDVDAPKKITIHP